MPQQKEKQTKLRGEMKKDVLSHHTAEDRGFEPLRAFTQHAFQACAIGH